MNCNGAMKSIADKAEESSEHATVDTCEIW